jgi:hypothetical protein
MANLQEVFRVIQAQRELLNEAHPSGYVFITSVHNLAKNTNAGTVSEVNTATAARLIIEATHRESTPEEIEAFKQRGELFNARMLAETQRRNAPTTLGRVIFTGGHK